MDRGVWLFFSACASADFYFIFFVLIFSGAGGWIPRPQMPFADFKTASELENVGGKNEE
jgi:hypothetical protein